jgi:hypothetical protein
MARGDPIIGEAYQEHAWHGRLRLYDDASFKPQHRLRAAAPEVDWRYWWAPPCSDQGPTSHCVAHGFHGLIRSGPVTNKPIDTQPAFYKLAQADDEWAGSEPTYYGTSVNAGFRVARAQGFIASWGWADEAPMALRHVLTVSPLIIGVDWSDGMDDTDENGYIWPTGTVRGGHCVYIPGGNRLTRNPDDTIGCVTGMQSWGEWGYQGKGRFKLTLDSFQKLLDGLENPRWRGEAGAPQEIKRVGS